MSPALCAVVPGPYVTIQDAGRQGWRRFGISNSGAMDLPALIAANTLVGNPVGTPALEFAHVGGTWEILAESCRTAVTGGNFLISVDGVALAPWRSHTLRRGQQLVINGTRDAVWGYLAVAGGFDLKRQLGSCATHVRFGIGGLAGGRLAQGDLLPLLAERAPEGRDHRTAPHYRSNGPIRVVLGPQDDYFTPDTIQAFLAARYRVSHRSDRMGTWLDGPSISHASGYNVVSDGVMPGCIQVPGAGWPVVLMMDCQTIGGYPKLATIITADLARFAQIRPGTTVGFEVIGIAHAQELYHDYRRDLDLIGEAAIRIREQGERPFWLRE